MSCEQEVHGAFWQAAPVPQSSHMKLFSYICVHPNNDIKIKFKSNGK